MSELDRVRWHCRRGMLELDLILNRFLDQHLSSLTGDELKRFKEVLEFEDDDLWHVLSGRAEVDDQRLQPIVLMIRDC
ncbi:MAG: succinate dehydrogenase assembly factor 2 [Burkholderiales bacterium]